MYLSHFGLEEPPFRITPHTEFFFAGANRGATLDALLYAITHDEGIVKVSGEVGSGKTMLCRVLIERLPQSVETIYLANPSLSRDEILHAIADDLHITLPGARTTVLIRTLQDHLIKLYGEGRRVVLLVDEAHAMPLESLEEVRLLSNLESTKHKLLQIVLFGQPELDEHLNLPSMRQLRERITHAFRLEPLVRSDIASYIDFRMRQAGYKGPTVFSAPALKLIASASEGLTRRINILADKSLLAAFADNSHLVTAKHARAAIRDSEFRGRARWPAKALLVAAGVALGLAAGFAMHALWRGAASPAATAAGSLAPAAPTPSPSTPPSNATPESEAGPKPPTPTERPAADSPETAAEAPANRVGAAAAPASQQAAATASASPASPEPASQAKGAPAGAQSGAQARAVQPGPAVENVPPAGKLGRERYLATQAWLQTAPGNRQSLQLAIFTEAETARMENFLRQATELLKSDEIYVYSVKIDGRQNYRVAYGGFSSTDEVLAAIQALPAPLAVYGPFQRSVGDMRRLNQNP
ncbi:MAG: AAA family ATPase [Burkholderiales bacterium]|jgi:type II secretory pathway predicted ATPase ExeA/septal ring-binding cell division protein DamX|nr:AAA family ATPase [Burkholderiales bacterium]